MLLGVRVGSMAFSDHDGRITAFITVSIASA
jgi:hypothetical protein